MDGPRQPRSTQAVPRRAIDDDDPKQTRAQFDQRHAAALASQSEDPLYDKFEEAMAEDPLMDKFERFAAEEARREAAEQAGNTQRAGYSFVCGLVGAAGIVLLRKAMHPPH